MGKRPEYFRQDSYGSPDADDREREALRKVAQLQGEQDEEDAVVSRLLKFIIWIAIGVALGLWRVFS
ncbi:MAG: hypothetical protein PHQ75_00215 [Thermoguttaceae bacterium]|nr:hypothetical protein [Thermoguttaceae bacterium]